MKNKSVIIINIDSFKHDFVKKVFFELKDKKSSFPNWYKYSKDQIIFNNILSAAPFTIVADNSMVIGLNPFDHGQTAWLKNSFQSISKNEKTLQYIFKQIGYETSYLSDNLSRVEVTPWNFDFYECLNTESIISKVSKEIKSKNNKPSFYFLKFNYLHDKVCALSGKVNSRQYYNYCLELLKKLDNLIGLLYENSEFINTYITTDHGIVLSDDPQSRHLENITGNYLTDKTIRTFFMKPYLKSKVSNYFLINGYLKMNNNRYPSTDIFATILKDNDITIENHPSNPIDGKSLKIRAISIGGGLQQSPHRPSSFAITTRNFRHVIYTRNIFGYKTFFYELFYLSKDPFQLSNLWELQSERRKKILISYYKNNLVMKKNYLNYKFFYKNQTINFLKSKLSKTAKYWIFKSLIEIIPVAIKVLRSRIKDRLIYLFRSGYHLNR